MQQLQPWIGKTERQSNAIESGNHIPTEQLKEYKSRPKFGIVIPALKERLDNLRLVLAYLADQTESIEHIVIVCDGWQLHPGDIDLTLDPTVVSTGVKHRPGLEQPRNVGVRFLFDTCEYVWFLDSDIIPNKEALSAYIKAVSYNPDGLIYGPYEWMPAGQRTPKWDLHNDYRWEMFKRFKISDIHRNEIGIALGCLGGNIVWNIDQFKRVGGFWNDLYMGRCEDGELGIRACAMDVPMSLASQARTWHLWHEGCDSSSGMPLGTPDKLEKNKRDVPMINERHPELKDFGIIVADKDGKRFDQICPKCNQPINTLLAWEHIDKCQL